MNADLGWPREGTEDTKHVEVGEQRVMLDPRIDIDEAVRVYLGGDPDSGAIQIGMRAERLTERCGGASESLRSRIDSMLSAAEQWWTDDSVAGDHTIATWAAAEWPQLSAVACKKIEAHVHYQLQH